MSIVPVYLPIVYTAPVASIATDSPLLLPIELVNDFAQVNNPEEDNLSMNMEPPAVAVILNVAAPGSKSAVPIKKPVQKMLPAPSRLMLLPNDKAGITFTIFFTHIKLPALSIFKIKVSWLSEVRNAVPGPGSKSTVPL